jgi:Zn-dependent protease with chaperone function
VEAVLWLHFVAIPFRTFFHFYCWNQEYECDRYALEKTDKKVAKLAMQELARCEIPHTALFSLIYREHPTVALRSKRILNKPIVNPATK